MSPTTRRGIGSRIVGRGRLLRSLRALVGRAERFGVHRAATPAELCWSITLADALDAAYLLAIEDPGARASLTVANERARVGRKVPEVEAFQ